MDNEHDKLFRDISMFGLIVGLALVAVMFWAAVTRDTTHEVRCQSGMCEVGR